MFSKHTRLVKHLPVLPVLWPLVRREGQFAPAGVQVAKELRHLQQISKVQLYHRADRLGLSRRKRLKIFFRET